MKMSIIAGLLAVSFAISASAHDTACSIAPPAHASAAQLATLAKVTQATAQATALQAIKEVGKMTIESAELEAEHGCLIWSFDIRNAGSAAIHEVAIDAGNGKLLSVTSETPAQQADEAHSDSHPGNAQH
ncbi:MAG TPA: hypothetical protein VIC31_12240 [Rudaea sp.]|jgi:hypothetical protein